MPPNRPTSADTGQRWPTARATVGRARCDSMVCSTLPGRLPPVGVQLPPGPLAARPDHFLSGRGLLYDHHE